MFFKQSLMEYDKWFRVPTFRLRSLCDCTVCMYCWSTCSLNLEIGRQPITVIKIKCIRKIKLWWFVDLVHGSTFWIKNTCIENCFGWFLSRWKQWISTNTALSQRVLEITVHVESDRVSWNLLKLNYCCILASIVQLPLDKMAIMSYHDTLNLHRLQCHE